MKRQNKLLFLVIVFIVSSGYTAHSQVQKYYLNVWGALGYANLIHEKIGEGKENLVQPLGGVGGLLQLSLGPIELHVPSESVLELLSTQIERFTSLH